MQGGQQGGGQGNFGHEEDHGGKGERIWEASAQGFGRGSAAPGAAGFVEDLGDGLENLWGVLGDEADGFWGGRNPGARRRVVGR